ncbi:hypothetical protein [Amycolatopsis vastitatis]|uniref:hypothetical protein n=1 Tax=Amycolatopsis vastitatis TaxID=1905142 RepID=UPI0013040C02|nr:hypothetical protein [Amycolatopsis vastitatis]
MGATPVIAALAIQRWVARQAGTEVTEDVRHWWSVQNPGPAAEAMQRFWKTPG